MGRGAGDVWIAVNRVAMHLAGGNWSSFDVPGAQRLVGTSDDDVWAVGFQVWHYDGTNWTAVDTGYARIHSNAL